MKGEGNPNEEGSEYKESIGLLYGIAFTIKMSKKGNYQIDGYFDYVVFDWAIEEATRKKKTDFSKVRIFCI